MTQRTIHRLKKDDVWPLKENGVVCAWCKQESDSFYTTPKRQRICDDCASMAEDVSESPIVISSFEHLGITYTITPPLRLELEIRYEDSEYGRSWWIEGIALDDHPLREQLFNGNYTGSVSQEDSRSVKEMAIEDIIEGWLDEHERQLEENEGPKWIQSAKEGIAIYEKVISPRPQWLKEKTVLGRT